DGSGTSIGRYERADEARIGEGLGSQPRNRLRVSWHLRHELADVELAVFQLDALHPVRGDAPHRTTRELGPGPERRREARDLAEGLRREDVTAVRYDADDHGRASPELLVDAVVDLHVGMPLRQRIALADAEAEPGDADAEESREGEHRADEHLRVLDH